MSSLDLIDWRLVAFSSLWILGLGTILAALSFGDAQARQAGQRLREVLGQRAYRLTVNTGLALFCLGLVGSAGPWWETALWLLLAGAFGIEAWRARPLSTAPRSPWSRRRKLAWVAGSLLGAVLACVGATVLLPDVLGLWAPRHYLLIAQNTDELRPTGGFMTGAAYVTVVRGRPVEIVFDDANTVDDLSRPYPLAPEPLRAIMGSELWLFRDANWSPDFPTAARQAADLYSLGTGRAVDTVIAFDQVALQYALAVIGPVSLADFPEPVTDLNLLEVIRGAWSVAPGEPGYEDWEAGRKDVLGPLAQAILERLRSVRSLSTVWALVQAGARALDERHALVYLPGPIIGRQLHKRGWDGAVEPGLGDFIMLVDANVGFNKVDAVVERRLAYAVDLTKPEAPRANLMIAYTNAGEPQAECQHFGVANSSRQYADYMHDCYWNFWRALLPFGAEVLSAPDNAVPGSQLLSGQGDFAPAAVGIGAGGTTEVSGLFVLPPGEEHTTTLSYTPPERVLLTSEDGRRQMYVLRVQKQPGTGALALDFSLTYPPDWVIASSRPELTLLRPGAATAEFTTTTDIALTVEFDVP